MKQETYLSSPSLSSHIRFFNPNVCCSIAEESNTSPPKTTAQPNSAYTIYVIVDSDINSLCIAQALSANAVANVVVTKAEI